MMLRLISWLLLASFSLASVPFAMLSGGEAVAHDEQAVDEGHHGPCPDQSPEGAPCADGCACLCCPGHTRSLPPDAKGSSWSLLGHGGVFPDTYDDARGLDVVFGIFRPPRSV